MKGQRVYPPRFEAAISYGALHRAFLEEEERDGPPGIDRERPRGFRADLEPRLKQLERELLEGSYQAQPVMRFFVAKKDGGKRPLGIGCLRDRLVQRALLRAMTPVYERIFLPSSHGYRPRRSAQTAMKQAFGYAKSGKRWVYEADIEDCFGSVDRDILGGEIERAGFEPRFRRLIRGILEAGALERGRVQEEDSGIPQGSPLSPLLANIALHPFDEAIEALGYPLIRYADDFVIFAGSREEAELIQRQAEATLAGQGLQVKESKTRLTDIAGGLLFLGYQMFPDRLLPSPKSLSSLQEKLQTFLVEDRLRAFATPAKDRWDELTALLHGWRGYFPSFEGVEMPEPLLRLAAAEVAWRFAESKACERFLSPPPTLTEPFFLQKLQALQRRLQKTAPLRVFSSQRRPFQEADQKGAGVKGFETPCEGFGGQSLPRHLQNERPSLLDEVERLREEMTARALDRNVYEALAETFFCMDHLVLAEYVRRYPGLTTEEIALPIRWRVEGPERTFEEEEIRQYLRYFRVEDRAYYRAGVRWDGEIHFFPQAGCFGETQLLEHLRGDAVYAFAPYHAYRRLSVAGFSVDLKPKVAARLAETPHDLEAKLAEAHEYALGIAKELRKQGVFPVLEEDGLRGRRFWFFFARPSLESDVQRWLRRLVGAFPPPPRDFALQSFPDKGSERSGGWGEQGYPIDFPLGSHAQTGRRSDFLSLATGEKGQRCSVGEAFATSQVVFL